MKYLSFDESNGSSTIDLPTLDCTIKLEEATGGLSSAAPIEHAELFKELLETGHRKLQGFKPLLMPITIRKTNCNRIKWKGEPDKCPVENYWIKRLVAKISFVPAEGKVIPFNDDRQTRGTMAIGVCYNERGIQLAFGHNVGICDNMNVFGEKVVSTYGSDRFKVAYDKAMEIYNAWLDHFDEIQELNVYNIERLKAIEVNEPMRLRLIGKLFEQAVRRNEDSASTEAPLNVTECGKMVKAGLKYKSAVSAWDFTNWATSVLKPESSDMVNILTRNSDLNTFILNETIDHLN